MTSGATQELVFCALQPHAESKIHNLTDKCVFRFLESNTRPQLILPVSDYFQVLFRYLLNLLDILTIENTFKFQALKFIHNWHIKKLPSIFTNSFTYAKDIHSYNTRYACKDNIHKVRTRANIGKQTIASLASELWQELPTDLKNLSSNCFSKQVKQHLLRKQSYL